MALDIGSPAESFSWLDLGVPWLEEEDCFCGLPLAEHFGVVLEQCG